MRKALVVIVVLFALLCSFMAAASQSAIDNWNQLCASYHFAPYPQASSTTFHQAYFGDNFDADFNGIWTAISKSMAIRMPPVGDDLLNATLESE